MGTGETTNWTCAVAVIQEHFPGQEPTTGGMCTMQYEMDQEAV